MELRIQKYLSASISIIWPLRCGDGISERLRDKRKGVFPRPKLLAIARTNTFDIFHNHNVLLESEHLGPGNVYNPIGSR